MRKSIYLVAACCLIPLSVYTFTPPMSLQAMVYFYLNQSKFERIDREFEASAIERWNLTELRVFPIFKTPSEARVYFIGSSYWFGRQYDAAYIINGTQSPTCKPDMFISHIQFSYCEIPLVNGWVINFESRLRE